MAGTCRGTFRQVRDGSQTYGQIRGPSWSSETGPWTLGEVWDGSGDPR